MTIIPGNKYGDVREQASTDMPHGLTPNTIEQLGDRMEKFLPGLTQSKGAASQQFFDGLLPDGANLSPRTNKQANIPSGVTFPGFGGNHGGGNTSITPQRPYQPEFETCFEDTVVLMASGEYKELKDIKIGDKVIDKDGFIQKVTAKRKMGIPKEMVEIKTWGGAIIYATDWHKWPVWAWPRTCACGCGEEVSVGRPFKLNHYKKDLIDFKVVDGGAKSYRQRRIPSNYKPFQKLRSDEIKKNDFLIIPRKFKELDPKVSLDQVRLLGYYIAEGHISNSYLELTFGSKEINTWVSDASSILNVLNIINNTKVDKKRHVARLRTKYGNKKDNLVSLSNWLIKHGGKSCYNKRLSGDVLRWPLEYKVELLRGMFRGDGSQVYASSYKKGYLGEQFQVTYYTASHDLARHVNLILAQLGVFSRIQYIKSGTGKTNNKKFKRNEGWRIVVSNKSARKLADLVWNKDTKYRSRKWKIRENCMLDDNYIYVPIKSVKFIKNNKKKSVINITVSGDKSYLVDNNIGTYNSPDRQQYPVHRILANRYWRLFYKLDPVIGNCLDMYSTMPWSDFQLSGEGVTGEIKEAFETMCQEVDILKILEYMVKEFMVIGECVPHNFFDESKGIWSYTALHNPDQLEVIDAPFIKMEPIVEFIPDDRLRAVLTSNNFLLKKVRDQMPPELVSRLIARQNIPLSPINMTFIPRRMHPYDTRGTSIISRMWRILMYEDAIYNASIATARRHAGPIKVAKLGNPQTGWIPSQEHERRLLQLLSQAEIDVNAWLVYHYGIQFEMVGTTDRIMNIAQHHEVIERIKLIAMGISKCFVYNTPINMIDGTYKPIQDVKKDDLVIDKNGQVQKVIDAWEDGVPEQLVEIKTKGCKKFIITPNHKFPVWAWPRTCACGCGKKLKKRGVLYAHNYNPKDKIDSIYVNDLTSNKKAKRIPADYNPLIELKAEDINPGDYLLIPRKFDETVPDISTIQARLLGYYVSEGHIIKGQYFGGRAHGDGFEFSLNKNEEETLGNDIKTICAKLGCNVNVRSCTQKSGIKVSTQAKESVSLSEWFIKHGNEYAPTKKLSKEVMCWPLEYKIELIRGLFKGDGTQYWSKTVKKVDGKFSKSLYVKYATTSHILARQIQLILAQMGFYAELQHKKATGFGKLPQLNPTLRGKHAKELADLIWEKDSLSNNYECNSCINTFRVDENYVYIPVKSVKTIQNEEPVFNISVTGSHSYLADNCASMNSFIHGEVTYASSITGLSVFLQRMLSLRNFFVNSWLIPKFFKPIAKINGWVKRDKKEINFRYRIKRSQKEIEQENRWIVPRCEWSKQLDHTVNTELVGAMNSLEQMGIKFSKTTKYTAVGKKFEEELNKIKEEQEFEEELNQYMTPEELAAGAPGAAPGGALPPRPGGGAPPPAGAPPGGVAPPGGIAPPGAGPTGAPPGAPKTPGGSPNAPSGGGTPPPGFTGDKEAEGGGTGPSGKKDPAVRDTNSSIWDSRGNYGNWSASEVKNLVDLLREGHTDSPLWGSIDEQKLREAIASTDPFEVIDVIEEHLEVEGYPPSDIRQLKKILDGEGILKEIAVGDTHLTKLEEKVDDSFGLLKDNDAMERLSSQLEGERPNTVKLNNPDLLLIGHGNEDRTWSGDISDILDRK